MHKKQLISIMILVYNYTKKTTTQNRDVCENKVNAVPPSFLMYQRAGGWRDVYVMMKEQTCRTDVLHWEKLSPGENQQQSRTVSSAAPTLTTQLSGLFVNGSWRIRWNISMITEESNASVSPNADVFFARVCSRFYGDDVLYFRAGGLFRVSSSPSFPCSFMGKKKNARLFLKEHNMAGPFLQHLIENIFNPALYTETRVWSWS